MFGPAGPHDRQIETGMQKPLAAPASPANPLHALSNLDRYIRFVSQRGGLESGIAWDGGRHEAPPLATPSPPQEWGERGTPPECAGLTESSLEACKDASDVGTTIGAGLIIGLWAAVDLILALTYFVYRLGRRQSRE